MPDPWGGFNQGFNQLINVLTMKRQEKRDESVNALAMEKMNMEKAEMKRKEQAAKMQDAVAYTEDMDGSGSPEDIAKFNARRSMWVQKWGEDPALPKEYDPKYVLALKGLKAKKYHAIGAGGLLEEGTQKVIPPVEKPGTPIVSWKTPDGKIKNLPQGVMPPEGSVQIDKEKTEPATYKERLGQKFERGGKLTPEELTIIGATKPPSTQVTVDIGPKSITKLGEEMSKSLVAEHQEAVKSAQSLQELQTAKELLKDPMITGAGANTILAIGKGLQQMGFSFAAEPIANTEAFAAHMGKQVGQVIKAFGSGTGLSDADREYAEKIAGGKITLTKQSIEKIVALNEKATRNVLANYNKKAAQAMKKPGGESLPYSLIIEIPGEEKPSLSKTVKSTLKQKTTRFQLPDGGFVNIPNDKVEEFLKDPDSKGARRVK